MCGRYSLTLPYEELKEIFGLVSGRIGEKRYNIAPSQDIPVIRVENSQRQLVPLHWGLIPFWAEDRKIAFKTINARVETAYKMPSYRAAFRKRRCLVPASSFFEWDRKSGSRQPYCIHRADGKPLAFAGLWEHWEDKQAGEVIESCTILTTNATNPVATIHDRMPVMLNPDQFDHWLDPGDSEVDSLRHLLDAEEPPELMMEPVSRYVNNAAHEGPECVEPAQVDR